MELVDVMKTYFRGEATEAWFFILPTGCLLVAMGAALLWGERTAFTWGISIPSIVFGLVLAGTGVGVGARTPAQVKTLEADIAAQAPTLGSDELPRMNKVMKNFHTTYVVFGILVALGLALLYVVRQDWAAGLGLALIIGGAVGLVIDGVAERRARPYVKALEAEASATPSP